jgi:DNA-binding transcriptional LysR family regulator
MELRQLRYFAAVAEAGNISRAAKKIFLTQPALSRQIKPLGVFVEELRKAATNLA